MGSVCAIQVRIEAFHCRLIYLIELSAPDMDLCCLIDSEERLSASDLVTMLGDLLERGTIIHNDPLYHNSH